MKLARVAAPRGREAVRGRQSRERAAAAPMRSAFPHLASLQVEFEFSDRTEFLPSPQVTVFHPPARAYFCFSCPYSDCDGEFDLTRPVTLLMGGPESRGEGQLRCTGTRHGGAPCTLCLEFSLTAHRS